MIILHLTGGLGNQMFQYAFGRATAARLGADFKLELTDPTLVIHNGYELERIFNIQASQAMQADMQAVLGVYRHKLIRKAFKVTGLNKIFKSSCVEEPHFHFSPGMLSISDNSYINGYWQSEKYFLGIEDEIRSEFAFKLPMSQQNAEVAKIISQTNSVSLHVRRNDFANNSSVNSIHGLCSLEYYKSAIRYIAERVECPSFYIFSDDSTWVKGNLKIDYPFEFVDHNRGRESFNDMRLMSWCQHHIIANSSFSWWGAWLNKNPDKIVIAPKRWFANSTSTRDLIPERWVRI
jgi:hypothetical protein